MSSTKPRGRGQRSSWRKRRAGSRGRARGEGLGAAGKFALAGKSALWGNFHPATKAEGVLAKTVFPPAGARSSVRENVWNPVIPADYSVQALVRDCAPRTPQFTRSSGQNSPGLQCVSYQALGRDTYYAKVVKCSPNWLPQPSPEGTEGPDVDKRQLGYQMSEKQTPY